MGKLAAEDQFSTLPAPKKLGAPSPGAPKPPEPPEPPASKPIDFAQQNKMWNQANDVAPQFSGPAPKRFANSEEFQTHAYDMDVANHTTNTQRQNHQAGLAPAHMYSSPEEQRAFKDAYAAKRLAAQRELSARQQAINDRMLAQGHGLISAQGDFADLYLAGPLVRAAGRGLYAGADKALEYSIKSPITPDYVKKTFYPGFQAVRDNLRNTARVYGQAGKIEPSIGSLRRQQLPGQSDFSAVKNNHAAARTERAIDSANAYNSRDLIRDFESGGGMYSGARDTAWSSAPKGTYKGKRYMRHELNHGLQRNSDINGIPMGFRSRQSGFLSELGAHAAESRGPLGQVLSGLGFAASPERFMAYAGKPYYSLRDKLTHGATSLLPGVAAAGAAIRYAPDPPEYMQKIVRDLRANYWPSKDPSPAPISTPNQSSP